MLSTPAMILSKARFAMLGHSVGFSLPLDGGGQLMTLGHGQAASCIARLAAAARKPERVNPWDSAWRSI